MTRARLLLVFVGLSAACGGTPHAPAAPEQPPVAKPEALESGHNAEVETPARPKLLSIDWNAVRVTTDADAIALWAKLKLTGDDWHDKLEEVPHDLHRALAIALVREGNFTCVPVRPTRECSTPVFDGPEPALTAGQTDPCLRRLLALWAIERLEADDVPVVMDGLRGIVALPPPESQLVVAALKVIPDAEPAKRLELLSIAFRSGQRELVNNSLGQLDEPFLDEAVIKHHIDGALEVLPVSTHRATYLTAVLDDKLATKARTQAIAELASVDDKLAVDLQTTLVKATAVDDCSVAAAAARALVKHGEPKYAPKHPRSMSIPALMRAMCVLASYEIGQGNDETSLLPTYIPARGLERVSVTYDALSDSDPDGDGDPHTAHSAELVPRADAVVPEAEDFARAMTHCKGTTCSSDDREFKLSWKPVDGQLMLYRMEIVERPPCPRT